MPTCAIIGCTSGYRSNNEKCHHFAIPKDPEVQELWSKALKPSGVQIKPGQAVCEKHFRSHEIMWERKHLAPDGTLLGISHYKIPRLRKGSVPSVFPWTDLIMPSEDAEETPFVPAEDIIYRVKSKNPVKETSAVPEQSLLTKLNETLPTDEGENVNSVRAKEASVTEMLDSESENSNRPSCLATLEELAASDITLPKGWNKHTVAHRDATLMVYSVTRCIKVGETLKTFVLKEIILKPDLDFQINVLNKFVDKKNLRIDISPVDSAERLQSLIFTLSGLNICAGTKLTTQQNQEIGSAVYQDPGGVWRHANCSILWTMSVCPFCRTARKSAIAKNRRKEKRGGVVKRLRVQGPSRDKILLEHVQKKYRNTQKTVLRAKATIEKLKAKIVECQKKIDDNNCLDQYLKSTTLPENQIRSLREIVAASKCENPRGRRYSKEWILLCTMLHMRSPSGYNFLQQNQILPLPDARTVRRYLSGGSETPSFDPHFFEEFELSIENREDLPKHGVLVITEEAARETVVTTAQTLSCEGFLEDNADGGEQVSDLSKNPRLVIMFHPLVDECTQPIAVFSSHQPVRGDVLTTLIVKAIVLLERVDAKVHGVVTDGSGASRKFWSEMGVSGQRKHLRNSFEHPTVEGRRVFVFTDTADLIKTIRNRLQRKKILQMDPTQPSIKWSDIEVLYKKSKQLFSPEQVPLCPKSVKDFTKVQLRLAVQVFSNTAARGPSFFEECLPELGNYDGTASFCDWINKMFDALNRNDSSEGVQPLNPDYMILEDSIRKLDMWEENVEKGLISKEMFLTPHTAEGLRVTLRSTLDIVTYLVNHCDFPWVLTGRINQDPLEVTTNLENAGCPRRLRGDDGLRARKKSINGLDEPILLTDFFLALWTSHDAAGRLTEEYR